MTTPETPTGRGIGTLTENSLHAALKRRYAQPGDQVETAVDGYVVDVVRGGELIEVQTRNFSAIKRKLARLLENHPVRLVYPIALEKWIIRKGANGAYSRRKSPRRGQLEHLFLEMVRIPRLAAHPNFCLEVLLTREEEILVPDGQGSWRRKGWSVADRLLVEVVESRLFTGPPDFGSLLPPGLPAGFTTRDLAGLLRQPPYLAQKMAYCLREMDVITSIGKRGRSYLYVEVPRENPQD